MRVFVCPALTFLFEGEVLCEVPALVVTPEHEEGCGVVDFERPEVQHTLQARQGRGRQTHTDRERMNVRWHKGTDHMRVLIRAESIN